MEKMIFVEIQWDEGLKKKVNKSVILVTKTKRISISSMISILNCKGTN